MSAEKTASGPTCPGKKPASERASVPSPVHTDIVTKVTQYTSLSGVVGRGFEEFLLGCSMLSGSATHGVSEHPYDSWLRIAVLPRPHDRLPGQYSDDRSVTPPRRVAGRAAKMCVGFGLWSRMGCLAIRWCGLDTPNFARFWQIACEFTVRIVTKIVWISEILAATSAMSTPEPPGPRQSDRGPHRRASATTAASAVSEAIPCIAPPRRERVGRKWGGGRRGRERRRRRSQASPSGSGCRRPAP